MGRRHEPDVDRDRPRPADPEHLAGLDRAQELGLQRERELADLAADLDAVVDFYDTRFGIGFTKQEKSDLVAFLRTL
jgi:hypothetical protein